MNTQKGEEMALKIYNDNAGKSDTFESTKKNMFLQDQDIGPMSQSRIDQ